MKETCVMKCIMSGQQIQASQCQSNNSRDFSLSTFPLGFWFFLMAFLIFCSILSKLFLLCCMLFSSSLPSVMLEPICRFSFILHSHDLCWYFGINWTWWGRWYDFTIEEILWLVFTTVLLTFLNCCLNSSYSVDSMLLLLYLYKCLILFRMLSLCSILCS